MSYGKTVLKYLEVEADYQPMTQAEELYAIANSLLSDGDLEIVIDGSPVVEVDLVEAFEGHIQQVWVICENGRQYPAEAMDLAGKLGLE